MNDKINGKLHRIRLRPISMIGLHALLSHTSLLINRVYTVRYNTQNDRWLNDSRVNCEVFTAGCTRNARGVAYFWVGYMDD